MSGIKINKFFSLILLSVVVGIYVFLSSTDAVFLEKKNQPIYSVDTEEKKIAITFDVNWAEKEYLYDILDVLDKYNVKATFFVMGKWVVYPAGNVEKLQEIYNRGHEIGNHSYVHPDFVKVGKERMVEEITKTEDIIKQTIGVKTELFRFPSGSYNDSGLKVVEELGYKSIHWNVDSVDWKQSGLESEYNRVIKKVKPGSIILFHNNGKYTPTNLDKLIPELQSQGYEFVKVGDMIYKEGCEIDNDGVQRLLK